MPILVFPELGNLLLKKLLKNNQNFISAHQTFRNFFFLWNVQKGLKSKADANGLARPGFMLRPVLTGDGVVVPGPYSIIIQ